MNQATTQDLGKLLLRVALGGLVLLHGIGKLRNGLDGVEGLLAAKGLPTQLAYGALVGEVVAPLLLILGLHARIGAGLVVVVMLFAIGLVHMGSLGSLTRTGGWAIELQAIYLVVAIVVLLLGPGRWSLNQR